MIPNQQLYAMTPKQQIVVFARHIARTVRCAKNSHDHRPLARMAKRDLETLWRSEKLSTEDRQVAQRCAHAIEAMMK